MRKRNIKINVYLNEEEKKMLEVKSNKARLSQSDFIRNLIVNNCEIESLKKYDDIALSLTEIIINLSKLKSQMDFLRYSNYSNYIIKQIHNISAIIKQIQK